MLGGGKKYPEEIERTFSDGETVFREGDESREMYVIQEGKIAILKETSGKEIHVATRERGEFFGEMALLESLPRSNTAKAIGPTQVLVIQAGGFLQRIRRDPTFAFEMLQRLSSRFRYLNDKLSEIVEIRGHDDPLIRDVIQWLEYNPSEDGDDNPR